MDNPADRCALIRIMTRCRLSLKTDTLTVIRNMKIPSGNDRFSEGIFMPLMS